MNINRSRRRSTRSGRNTTYTQQPGLHQSTDSVFLSDGSQTDAADPTISVTIPQLSASALGLSSYGHGNPGPDRQSAGRQQRANRQQVYTFVTSGNANAAGDVASARTCRVLCRTCRTPSMARVPRVLYLRGRHRRQSIRQITSVNGGSAVVQALAAGNAGNDVTLTTNLTSSSGAAANRSDRRAPRPSIPTEL